MKKIITIIFIIINIYFIPSYAYPDARTFNKECLIKKTTDQVFCLAYLKGFLDGLKNGQFLKWLDKDITVGTLGEVYKKEMNDHPEKGDDDAADVLIYLLLRFHYIEFNKEFDMNINTKK